MATAEALLTAEEYYRLPDNGQPTELIRGRIVPMNMPFPRHGEICARISYLLQRYLEDHELGRVISNDAGVVTERNPDSVRGPDVAFYSYARVPRGPLPEGYLAVAPELVFEVRSAGDRWSEVFAKVAEYLRAGVLVVCVLDPRTERAILLSADQGSQTLTADQDFALPDLLTDLRVPVRRFFE
jgi:Uma2 family endonuclease